MSTGVSDVCASGLGSVRGTEPIHGLDEPWPDVVGVARGPGESYLCEQALLLQLAAESEARLLCLQPVRWWRVLAGRLLRAGAKYAMISHIRRGVEQSGSSSGS